VVVADGKVTGLLSPDESLPDCAKVVDAQGRFVIPGGVDPHCHIAMELGRFSTRDGYCEASLAALAGGTTTVIDFAIPASGESPVEAVRRRRRMAVDARCDTALHACVIEYDSTTENELRCLAADGVVTVKLFTTYRDQVMANADTIYAVLAMVRETGGMAYVHAEANPIVEQSQMAHARCGHIGAADHAGTRPEIAETAAVSEILAAAESLDASVYLVHQSTEGSIDLIRNARRRGVRAYAETCPHYLVLDQGLYSGPRAERFVCCPPLRHELTVERVRHRAVSGGIDTIGSDHCCYDRTQKASSANDVRFMPNGMPGVQTRLPVVWSALVRDRGLSPERFVALTSSNAARLNGLSGRKGVIAPGADADVVVLDDSQERTVRASDLIMASDYTPYEGMRLVGWPRTVVARGQVVVDDGILYDPGAIGRALRSDRFPPGLLT
jgi:dihydropyrimidinase